MRISRIYYEDPLNLHLNITLNQKTSHYVSTVLRLKVGAGMVLFNGDGIEYFAIIQAIEKTSDG